MEFSLVSQLKNELTSLFHGYPEFVFSRKKVELSGESPVFVFHTIEPTSFEELLIFLKENGYKTLSIDEFQWVLKRGNIPPKKSVLLTVDDGRSSFWRFGYPLLKKYDLKATLFIIPGLTSDETECRDTLSEVWNGKRELQEVHNLDPKDKTLCNWTEIRKMFESGVVSIESHSLFHKEVFIEPNIRDFISPDTPFIPYNTPVSPYLEVSDIGKGICEDRYFGLPILKSTSLMRGLPYLRVSLDLAESCRDFYLKNSRNGKSWKRNIKDFLIKGNLLDKSSFVSSDQIKKSIEEDMQTSMELIHDEVDYNAGNHLCLPYSIGSDVAVQAAKTVGMRSCFWGTIKGHRVNGPGADPYYRVRIKNDFLWRLPGVGRKSILSVYGLKFKRRVVGNPIF